MSWHASAARSSASLRCRYCAANENFPHSASFEHAGRQHSLFACPDCASLLYDPLDISGNDTSLMAPRQEQLGRKYYLETGYSADFVARGVLVGLPDKSPIRFVDIGCGMGMSLAFARDLMNLPVTGFEPTSSGRMGSEIFGIDIRDVWLTEKTADAVADLKDQPCFLHFNSVLEHLADPRETLSALLDLLPVHAVSAIVPDGAAVQTSEPFIDQLSILAPGDHGHLPTALGLENMMRALGFGHVRVTGFRQLLHVAASHSEVPALTDRSIAIATELFLDRLALNPHPWVRSGALARLICRTAARGDRRRSEAYAETLGISVERPLDDAIDWDDESAGAGVMDWESFPFYAVPVSFWLGMSAFHAGDYSLSLRHLECAGRITASLAKTYPHFALESTFLNWEAIFIRARIMANQGRGNDAQALLRRILDAGGDPTFDPPARVISRARAELDR